MERAANEHRRPRLFWLWAALIVVVGRRCAYDRRAEPVGG